MSINCPRCNHQVREQHIDLEKRIAVCDNCHLVFATESLSELFSNNSEENHTVPSRLKLQRFPQKIRISYRHTLYSIVFSTIFAIVWLIITLFVYREFSSSSDNLPEFVDSTLNSYTDTFFIVVAIFALVGCIFAIIAITLMINRTTIQATANDVTIRNRPIPIPFGKRFRVKDIADIFTVEHVAHDIDNGDSVTYHVYLARRGDSDVLLVNNFHEPVQALFIEHSLKAFLSLS